MFRGLNIRSIHDLLYNLDRVTAHIEKLNGSKVTSNLIQSSKVDPHICTYLGLHISVRFALRLGISKTDDCKPYFVAFNAKFQSFFLIFKFQNSTK